MFKKTNIKKKKIFVYYASAVAILVVAVIFSAAYNKVAMQTIESGLAEQKPIIIIDAGHGGEDGGAVGRDGTQEKTINLNIANELELLFKQSGFAVKMTRETDTAIGDNSLNTIRSRKTSDMHKRLELYNSDENNVVISVHQNTFSDSNLNGSQVFYSPNNSQSQTLAENIRTSILGLLQPNNKREAKTAQSSIFLMHNATVPAVIVECGFLTNPGELAKLKDEDYQKQMAFAIFSGFMDFYSNNY
ncbi:MAG: N-acetylmuramoyl-L-alanine amidase [Oscillospiraceae bacterium]|jgi:N-acetylmuramoyl-L-alanine amidase|nr:N-acetylmuramoyl-L-alanine amidase [Oscillospiraceae bacterium]